MNSGGTKEFDPQITQIFTDFFGSFSYPTG
jgi:hypothetical protein